jgi:hypothetical protein
MDRIKIKSLIEDVRNRGCFGIMESFPEDFTESRKNWDSLAEDYRTLYYVLMEIESEVNKENNN